MKSTTITAALASCAVVAGSTIAALAWPTASGAQATSARDSFSPVSRYVQGTAALGLMSLETIDQPSTWFVTCANDRGHSVLGGRMLVNGYGAPVELVGPVAVTLAGASSFARQAESVYLDECEPTHLHEVWMVTNAREVGIGEAAELSR